jgi:hypothetical protein
MTRLTRVRKDALAEAFDIVEKCMSTRKHPIPVSRRLFEKILDGLAHLMLQVIEGQAVEARLLVLQSVPLEELRSRSHGWGFEFVSLGPTLIKRFELSEMKVFLPCAGGSRCQVLAEPHNDTALRLHGLLFLPKPLKALSEERSPWLADPLLDPILGALEFSFSNRQLTISVGGDPLVGADRGFLRQVPQLDEEIKAAVDACEGLRERIQAFAGEATRERSRWASMMGKVSDQSFDPISAEEVRSRVENTMRDILSSIAAMRHGATLVFVGQFQNGETDTRFQPGFIPTRIPVGDAIVHQLSVYQVEWMRCQGSDDEWLQRRDEAFTSERIRALKSAVVALSRTDGALIFDSHLELVAAGAFLKVTSVATATGGARRKSAESFVRSNPGTAAVVISQDGEVILFK